MNWDLTSAQSDVWIGGIFHCGSFLFSHNREVIRLLPGLKRRDYPMIGIPKQANTFIRKFMEAKGDFSMSEFWTLGWVHSMDKTRKVRMVGFVLKGLREPMVQSYMYQAIRAIQYGITLSHFHFFAMLKQYNPNSCTFFTQSGEMGFALHEMYESLVCR